MVKAVKLKEQPAQEHQDNPSSLELLSSLSFIYSTLLPAALIHKRPIWKRSTITWFDIVCNDFKSQLNYQWLHEIQSRQYRYHFVSLSGSNIKDNSLIQ